jgi:hypothetical protein
MRAKKVSTTIFSEVVQRVGDAPANRIRVASSVCIRAGAQFARAQELRVFRGPNPTRSLSGAPIGMLTRRRIAMFFRGSFLGVKRPAG